jgi:hypothetical protein
MTAANTLAYYDTITIMAVKSFILLAKGFYQFKGICFFLRHFWKSRELLSC